MKRITALLLLFAVAISGYAGTFYGQLCDFNFNWIKYPVLAPKGEARNFNSDKELIRAHLAEVLLVLKTNPTDQLSAEQKKSRQKLAQVLAAYREAGNFPMNYYRECRVPVFIDEHGTHCAVGYLMRETGHGALALRIAAADNYLWVKDIHDAELPAWQQASGFTTEELALIQGAYDFYEPRGFYLPNKYETPQMPVCTTAYFTAKGSNRPLPKKTENVWCRGEGKNGVLNGRWEQNYAVGLPWIVGYFENGKRTGQWEEYYKGTNKLCRTEQWRNHKLNGTRVRYDLDGNIIEKIVFQDGNVVTKFNFDLERKLTYARTLIDTTRVRTNILNSEGELVASGMETIYNPGNLLWFQNIELTALNSASITSRAVSAPQYYISSSAWPGRSRGGFYMHNDYSNTPLVQYKKEGDWTYYQNKAPGSTIPVKSWTTEELLGSRYYSYRTEMKSFNTEGYNLIRVNYKNDRLQNLYGYSDNNFVHFHVDYYERDEDNRGYSFPHYYGFSDLYDYHMVKSTGFYNKAGQKTGEWKYFNARGELCKTENYLLPWTEEGVARR